MNKNKIFTRITFVVLAVVLIVIGYVIFQTSVTPKENSVSDNSVYAPEYSATNTDTYSDYEVLNNKLWINDAWVSFDNTITTLSGNGFTFNCDEFSIDNMLVRGTCNNNTYDIYVTGNVGDSLSKGCITQIMCNEAGSTVVKDFKVGDDLSIALKCMVSDPQVTIKLSEDSRACQWVNKLNTCIFTIYYNTDKVITGISYQALGAE